MLGRQAVGITQMAKQTRQTVCRIKGDPAGADQRNGVILGHVLGARNGDTAAVSRGGAAGFTAPPSKSLQQTRRGVVGRKRRPRLRGGHRLLPYLALATLGSPIYPR